MIVYAEAAAEGATVNTSAFSPLILMGVFLLVMYFVMIRPQRKKEKETREMLAALAVGDVITTIGGIIGKIVKVKEDEVYLQTGKVGNANEQSVIRFSKWAIRDVVKKADVKEEAAPAEELEAPAEEAEKTEE